VGVDGCVCVDLEVGTHVRPHNRVERWCFDRELVTRVYGLGYEIQPNMAKRRVLLLKVVLKSVLL
jgi:hypothetical protein